MHLSLDSSSNLAALYLNCQLKVAYGVSMPEHEDVEWLSPEERAAWLAAATMFTRLPAALDAQLQRDAGVSFFEYMVLAILSEQPDRCMPMSDIAEFASASLSRLSHTAARLEKQGLITREAMPGCGRGRRFRACITDAGMAKVEATAPGHVMQVRRLLFDDTDPLDLAALARIGQRVGAKATRALDSN